MSITHDNSGTRRTQAQREAARLIESGEFIAADTPAGRAIIDALPEAARRADEARKNRKLRFLEPIVVKKPPTAETSIADIGKIIIHHDRDMMREELRKAMERAAKASFIDSDESEAVMLCLAIVSGDTIGIQVNTVREDIITNIECHAIFAYDDAAEALKKHNGLSARFEASFSQPKIKSMEVV